MTKADFEQIVKTRCLKGDSKIEEKTEGAKLKSVEILGVKEPFQVIIDDRCGPLYAVSAIRRRLQWHSKGLRFHAVF